MADAPVDIDLSLCESHVAARAIDAATVEKLAESIRETGHLINPITVRRSQARRGRGLTDVFEVLAGMHRVKACRRLGWATIPAFVRDVDDLHAELILIDENLRRNDLSPAARSRNVARRKAIYEELHPETKHGATGRGRPKNRVAESATLSGDDGGREPAERFTESTADATGQSERTVQQDARRGEALGDALLAKVEGTSLDKGEELDALAKLSPEKREALIDRAAAGEKVSAKVAAKQERRDDRERELAERQLSKPQGVFGVIVEDYEWDQQTWSEAGKDRHAGNHYPTSTDAHAAEEIFFRTEDRFACAADDCVLWMWTTIPHLAIALDVMRLRGFEYKSHYIWCKDKIITGYWSRAKHELLLIGVKGNIPCPAMGTQDASLIAAPAGEHSEKPECVMAMIERYFPNLPKLELNARRARPGWTVWGLDAPTSEAAE